MKTKLFLLLLLICSYSFAQIPTANLVGHYDFNNGSLSDNLGGASFTKTGTNATTITDRFGNANKAISLNGDDLTRPDIDFDITNSNPYLPRTVSFWLKTGTNDSNVRIVYNDNDQANMGDTNFVGLTAYLQNGKIKASNRVGTNGSLVTHSIDISDNVWHHVVIQGYSTNISGTKRFITYIYVDDVKEGGTTYITSAGGVQVKANEHIGNISFSRLKTTSLPNNSKYIDGLDEVLFYTRLLSDAEVNAIASNTSCLVSIPDTNFKNYLVGNSAINTNGDTEIQCSEASAFTGSINVTGENISDLTGIEDFVNITELSCSANSLTSLDVSNNVNLISLYCYSNSLSSLNVSNVTSLETLQCNDNFLASINVSQNTALTTLWIQENSLTTLDISQNLALENLSCHNNSLTAIDVSQQTALSDLWCNNNILTALNVANGNNSNFTNFIADYNPSLICITVDDVAYSTANWMNIDPASSFSANCNPTTVTYVNHAATGSDDGTSWANGYTHLEDALAAAADGDEIWIATGTYLPNTTGSQTTPFSVNNADLKIYGGFAGTENQLSDRVLGTNETILSGDFDGNDVFVNDHLTNNFYHATKTDNSYGIISITSAGNNLVLDGVTVSNAHYTTNSVIGAITKEKTVLKLTLKNCTIKNNVAAASPGLVTEFDLNNTSSARGALIIENCIFKNNMSRFASGIYCYARANTNVDITVENTVFDNNISGNLSAGLRGLSGAASWFRSLGTNADVNVKLTNNTYVNNICDSDGSSIDDNNRAPVVISKTAGTLNAEVVNCIFWNNYRPTSSSTVISKSITNTYQDAADAIAVKNSIDQLNFNDASISSKVNTSNSNPYFTNLNNNYTLQAVSPAINSGDNSYVTSVLDLAGNQRVYDTTVDMGAYEYQTVLSIEDTELSGSFKMYPNPVNTTLNIQLDESLERVEVYSILGRKVLESATSNVNVSHLSSGMYLLKVYTQEGKVGVKRFVKK